MDKVKRYFSQDQLANLLGIELTEVAPGRAIARMTIREDHYNSLRMVHGGATFTLADLAFAAASNSHGSVAVGIAASISYVKAATTGTLTAEAREESLSPRLATYSVRVTDDANEIVAVFHGTVYRKRDPLPLPAQ
ncbi:MAG: PaaI family thioesterase [Phycisphaerae bacterium]|nr:PaaI family thioesterase [Phycisphaerae bacterium]